MTVMQNRLYKVIAQQMEAPQESTVDVEQMIKGEVNGGGGAYG